MFNRITYLLFGVFVLLFMAMSPWVYIGEERWFFVVNSGMIEKTKRILFLEYKDVVNSPLTPYYPLIGYCDKDFKVVVFHKKLTIWGNKNMGHSRDEKMYYKFINGNFMEMKLAKVPDEEIKQAIIDWLSSSFSL